MIQNWLVGRPRKLQRGGALAIVSGCKTLDVFIHDTALAIDTLYLHLHITLEHVCEQLFCITDEEVHGSDRRQGTHNPTDSDNIMPPFYDHL